MKKPLISIVIPSYNKGKYIKKTLESIISQNYEGIEVLIIDGGSTDGTLSILNKYSNKYPEIIKFESKKDKGQWDAINRGFSKAKGKILTYINADDVYMPGVFKEIERLYRTNIDALWFAGRGKVIKATGESIAVWSTIYKNILLYLNFYPLLLTVNYLMQPSVFITKTAWEKYKPFSGYKNYVLEYEMWLKIGSYKMPVVSNKYFSSFRIEPGTITKNSSSELLKQDEKIIKKFTENRILLFIHRLHNLGRLAVNKFI